VAAALDNPGPGAADQLHDWRVEAQVLGALVRDPAPLAEAVAGGVTEATFHLVRHRLVFRALCRLKPEDHREGGPAAVVDALRRAGDLEVAGGSLSGPEAVADLLFVGFESPKNAAWAWRERLFPLQRAREAVDVCQQAARSIREQPDDADAIVANAVRQLAKLSAAPDEVSDAH
jgi:hypothetical protein